MAGNDVAKYSFAGSSMNILTLQLFELWRGAASVYHLTLKAKPDYQLNDLKLPRNR